MGEGAGLTKLRTACTRKQIYVKLFPSGNCKIPLLLDIGPPEWHKYSQSIFDVGGH